jgi:methyl-accepting chemotaxis protein
MDGTIGTANANFLDAPGYSLGEITGKHHSPFVEASERDSAGYREFWNGLNRGRYQAGEYKRIGKGGKEIWIQASYNPILDLNGRPFKVVKYPTDTTAQVVARMKSEKVRGMMEQVAAGAEELNASVREIFRCLAQIEGYRERCRPARREGRRTGEAAQLCSRGDERHRPDHRRHHRADQLVGAQRHDRVRARGRSRSGFAVVASEVKNPANQAKQATDKITKEIGSLNGISGDVVTALKSIRQATQSVSEYVTSTAAAVEQQSTVTRRNVDQHATRRGRGRKHRTASGVAIRCLLSENARVVVIAMSVREPP